jgi:hypothetical protein
METAVFLSPGKGLEFLRLTSSDLLE